MPLTDFQRLLSAAIFCSLLGSAHAQPEIPPSWNDPVQTRALEELLHQAAQSKDTRKLLSATYTQIMEKDVPVMEEIQDLVATDKRASGELAFKMGPCHYASMAIRGLIVMVYEDAKARKGRQTIPIPTKPANIFAEQMDRCELLRFPRHHPQLRLVGTPTIRR